MEEILAKAREFDELCRARSAAHFKATNIYQSRNYWFGIPATLLSSIVATSIFITLSKDTTELWVRATTGAVSVLTAALVALQTFLRFAESAADNRRTAVSFQRLKNLIAVFIVEFSDSKDRDAALKGLKEITAKLDVILDAAPAIPDWVYNSGKKARPPLPSTSMAGAPAQ